MNLISTKTPQAKEFLWKMLIERDPIVNISHKKMPTRDEHRVFVDTHGYQEWYIIEQGGKWIGQIYLTYANEIGIHLITEAQGKGLGRKAVLELMKRHGPGDYLANIAPGNIGSQDFFRALGFKLIQYTFELEHVEN